MIRAEMPLTLSSILCQEQLNTSLCENYTTMETDVPLPPVRGHPLRLIYNRVPKTGSEMLRMLLKEQSDRRSFNIDNAEIFVPFLLSDIVQEEVVQHVSFAKTPFLYERHMYFLDFHRFKQPQPSYINIVRDPINRATSEYYWSRKICREQSRCYFEKDYLNETLDECVRRRSPEKCVDQSQGVNSMVSFFCGHDPRCKHRSNFTLKEAKKNIIKHYAVVGFVEELYNFFFVLEHTLPRYFKNICLTYMSDGQMREEKKTWTKGSRPEPDETTKRVLRQTLADEYEVYDFIKSRFRKQFQQVLRNTYSVFH